jgi:methionyl-tRNA formyltransferase
MSRPKKENKKIKIIFMGTPEFSLPGLKSLLEDNFFKIIAVFTQTDKPKGRKQKLTPPPVKELALKYNIPIFQPEKIKLETENIRRLKPNLIVVIAYGKIIPQEILDIPNHGCINIHASLLPKYRGAACLNAPIINNDKETGITVMKMDAGMDTGPILKQFKIDLDNQSTLPQIHDKLSQLSAEILPTTLKNWIKGKITPQKQDNNFASYVKIIKKEDGRLNWNQPANKIDRLIRGLNPWPGTFTKNEENKIIKILRAKVEKNKQTKNKEEKAIKIGQVHLKDKKLAIRCGQDDLIILELQAENGKILSASDFLSGHRNFIGQILK